LSGYARLSRAWAAKKLSTPKDERTPKQLYQALRLACAPEWLSSLEENELDDPDFETRVRSDIFSHRVFVFTPKGDVVDLPAHATPVDFAYAIHSDLGNHVSGAKVNGKMVPLDTELHNGDIVEIQTKKNAQPKQKWLDFTSKRRSRAAISGARSSKGKTR
jgi:(p)ppGpp synthase/HD superfamily hydrolase